MNKIILLIILSFFGISENLAQKTNSEIVLDYNKIDSILDEVWENEDYMLAIKYINHFLSYDTSKAYLYYNRAIAKRMLYDFNGACEDLSKAKELDFENFSGYINRYFKYFCDTNYRVKKIKKQYYSKTDIEKDLNYRPRYTRKDTLRGMLGSLRRCYNVTFYDLHIKIVPQKKYIYGRTDVYFNVIENTQAIQLDLFENLKIDSIVINRQKLDFTRSFDAVFVNFENELEKDDLAYISVYYQGKPLIAEDPPWNGGFVWKRDRRMNHFIGVCCEHLGASSWWPNKDHLSDKPDSMMISIEVPEDYEGISNGNLIEEQELENKYIRYTWKVNYPIANYNATFYCGNYLNIQDTMIFADDTLSLDYYFLPHDKSKALPLFKQSKEVLRVYSELFGPYPFPEDGFGLVESPYAGMEHQGAIAFGNKFRNRDNRYLNNEFDYIIVHEIAHEWWGNALSFSDMADAWLSEGFATYSEMLFMEYKFGYQQYLKEIFQLMNYTLNFWPIIGNYNVNENTFAGGDIYSKGAIILHNLRCVINNDSTFMKLLKDYYQKYKYQSIGSDKFIKMAKEYANENLDPFFNKYLYDSDLPVLSYNIVPDGNDIIFLFKWTEVETGFSMPFTIIDEDNKQYILNGSTSKIIVRFQNTEVINFLHYSAENIEFKRNGMTYFTTNLDPDLRIR